MSRRSAGLGKGEFSMNRQHALRNALLFSFGLLLLAGSARGQGTSTVTSTVASTVINPTVTFSTPGTKQVTLQACNEKGCDTVVKNVVVLDPRPQISSMGLPARAGMNHSLALQATATGRPALSYKWTFSGLTPTVVTGNPATWTPLLLGDYQATLEVTNASGVATSTPVTVQVVPWTFEDVPPTYWVWRFIENLAARGVSSGCGGSPPLYCPEANVTRGEMAVLLLRSKEGGSYVPPPCTTPLFTDIPCSHPLAPWINELARRGVTAGCGGGYYCPNLEVSRAQMAVFLLATKEGAGWTPDPTCTTAPFNDVPCSTPFAIWIRELVVRGITAGCGSGSYCPVNPVNQAQMSVFLSVTFGLTPAY